MSSAPPRIVELIETFDRNIETYHSQQYNETQLRREFIDPFFEELGWDVSNKQGYAQAYKEVIHEDAIKVGTATKAPDYSFRIGGVRKFFLEAKKPSINIGGDPHPAYQLRRYAWSAKLPVSILTDFEEFAVYDCQTRPKQTDGTSTARIMFLTCKDYIDKWGEIADIFSKEAVLKGSFDKFAVSPKAKRGTTTVDKEFLREIETWREQLAKIIAHRNRTLTIPEINFAVQKTIDRIIFLRMCEDRGIETYGQLQALIPGTRVYPRLCEVFERADEKYNSGLFHFRQEKGRSEQPDEWTLNLVIDDKDLKYILNTLYYPQSPYEFSVLPAEILGNVYEQFLGSVIQVSRGRRIKVEPKPEVKKAGGIYYTPDYIVNYIVKNTVGRLCENKTPKEIAKIKILDPACGSGSFLLGAYTYLLNYHRDWYVENNPKKYTKQIYQGRGGLWFLTIAEKKKILLNNIFGVDIDSQAIEVTKLSLLLKVLEGESQESLLQFRERALPDLGNNIKCGNSLIGSDFFDNPDIDSSDNKLRLTINPFDWKSEFRQIFSGKNPGFDVVIGNPPYVSYYSKKAIPLSESERNYYKDNFEFHELLKGKSLNTIMLFLEKATHLLCQKGFVSFIIDIGFHEKVYQPIRKYLSHHNIVEIVSDISVFTGVKSGQVIVLIQRTSPGKSISLKRGLDEHIGSINYSDFAKPTLILPIFSKLDRLFARMEKYPKLSSMVNITCGLEYGALRNLFVSDTRKNAHYHKVVNGAKGIPERYQLYWDGEYVLFDKNFEEELVRTKRNYSQSGKYVHFISGDEAKYREPKLLFRQSAMNLICTYDDKNYYALRSLFCINRKLANVNLKFICGILNSKLLSEFARQKGIIRYQKGKQPQIRTTDLSKLPICFVDAPNKKFESNKEKITKLVEQMLDLNKKLARAKVPDEKTKLQRQIQTTDSAIDNLVYDLYNLTPEEIKIIENASG
jgi:type I restriction-modification system DNA methylase subunit